MGLKVVGAGFGRTGTLSLKAALEQLGVGPCYHMLEVHKNPAHAGLFSDAADGKPVDWQALFDGWGSAVDWPASYFWRELADAFPDALVLLSVRDAERWYASIENTIFKAMQIGLPPEAPEAFANQASMGNKIVLQNTFGGRTDDRAHVVEVYERHNQAVRDAFAGSDRFLEFQPSQGWGPLCERLGVPIPDAEFPRVNDTESFQERFKLNERS
jgi:hypothetical protein